MFNPRNNRTSRNAASADNSRRSFFFKLGAGASGALASTTGLASADGGDANDLALKVALLEEEKALRELHRAFEQALDGGRYEDVPGLFADDAEIIFNGGVFANRSGGISRLFLGHFRSGRTGRTMTPAPGFELEADAQLESIEVSPDRLSASAQFPYSIQVGQPIESDSSLAAMARLHGDGVRTWWEGGVYHVTYGRAAPDRRWEMSRLEYRSLSRANYRPGRSYAEPVAASPFATRYPEDPQGPDALV